MTPAEHAAQRDMVRLAELMQTSRADRRDMPRRKPPVVVITTPARVASVVPHVFVVPVVTEHGRGLL